MGDMKITKNDNKLTIEVELEAGHPSSTGKTTILYSSGGFKYEQGVGVSLNVIKAKH
jgi:hypothetical protein